MSQHTIVVIGQGEIGRPVFELLQKNHASIRAVDLDPVTITEPVSFMHICYPFAAGEGFMQATITYAEKYHPEVIVVHSTVAPGTTRAIAAATRTPSVYSPVRGKHTKMAADLLHYKKFIAGTDATAVEQVVLHFQTAGLKTATLSTPEALELAKLCETTYLGVLIAWAQEMDRFSRACHAEYAEIPRFFEEIDYLPRHMFVPGYIGGHCVMPNIAILKQHFSSYMLDAIVASNQRKAEEMDELALRREHGKGRTRIEPKPLDSQRR